MRKRKLPLGWYPQGKNKIEEQIKKWNIDVLPTQQKALAIIAPHAGWDYSGALAAKAISHLRRDLDTVVVIGGHLAPGSSLRFAPESFYETIDGAVAADLELLEFIKKRYRNYPDTIPDNSVEVHLPLVHSIVRPPKMLWLRTAPDSKAVDLGRDLSLFAAKRARRIGIVGSTDLTHYGRNFNFTPAEAASSPREWVKSHNDKPIISAFINMDTQAIIQLALQKRNACAAGAAACSTAFAAFNGVKKGKFLGYHTSYDTRPSDSFVGYAAVAYL